MAAQRSIAAFNAELASDANFDADNIMTEESMRSLRMQLQSEITSLRNELSSLSSDVQQEFQTVRSELQEVYDELLAMINSIDNNNGDDIGSLFDQLETLQTTVQALSAMSDALGLASAAAAAAGGAGAAATTVSGLAGVGGAIGVLAAGVLGAALLGSLLMGATSGLGTTEEEVTATLSNMKTTLDDIMSAEGANSLAVIRSMIGAVQS